MPKRVKSGRAHLRRITPGPGQHSSEETSQHLVTPRVRLDRPGNIKPLTTVITDQGKYLMFIYIFVLF